MPGRVLVIEDVATDRIVMKVKLSAAHYDVVQAANAAEGLQLARAEAPCLILLSAELGQSAATPLSGFAEGAACAPTPSAIPAPMPRAAPWVAAAAPIPAPAPAPAANGALRPTFGPAAHADAASVPSPAAGPGMSAVALCRRLRGHPSTASVPIVVTTRRDATEARLALLDAGADEVLLRPLDERFLLARIRSLLRARDEMAELRLRESTSRVLGFAEAMPELAPPGQVVLVSPEAGAGGRLRRSLERHLSDRLSVSAPSEILADAQTEAATDVFIVDASEPDTAQLTLSILPELRARSESRHAAIIVLTAPDADGPAILALDLGANDVAPAPGDPAELSLRIRKQIRWKQGRDRLRQTVRDGLHAAITDPLTGLYNRRYAMPHLARIVETARESGRRFALILADLDHFKAVNDTHGHAAGDAVLVETARRLRENLRGMDLVARIGGEEFLVAIPDTGLDEARIVAGRLCGVMRDEPIALPGGRAITVTMSMGLAMGGAQGPSAMPLGSFPTGGAIPEPAEGGEAEATRLIEAADQALYGAKSGGRAQYKISASAA